MGMQFWRKKRYWIWSAAAAVVLLTGALVAGQKTEAVPHARVTTRSVYAEGTAQGETTTVQIWETVTVEWTGEKLASALCQALDEAGLPPSSSEIALNAPDTVIFSGSIGRKLLESYGKAHGLSQTARLALALLPETVTLQGELGLGWDDGLTLTVRSISASGIALDSSWMPEDLGQRLDEKLDAALEEQDCRITDLEIGENLLILTCETPQSVVQ